MFMNDKIIPLVRSTGYRIINPWNLSANLVPRILKAQKINSISKRTAELRSLNANIGKKNTEAIRTSDLVLAALDGSDVDSGMASEIGFAYALNKKILAYRGGHSPVW
jgi:nucleoside 2-deoxyribosyltransferase